MYYSGLKKGKEYYIKFEYMHSILALHRFDVCPHLPVEISMISVDENKMIKQRIDTNKNADKESKKRMREIFNDMS